MQVDSSGSSAFSFIVFVISSSENGVVFYSQMEECLFCRELAEDAELSLLINYIKSIAHSFTFMYALSTNHNSAYLFGFKRKKCPLFSSCLETVGVQWRAPLFKEMF